MSQRSNGWMATCILEGVVFLCLVSATGSQTTRENTQLPSGPGKQLVQNVCSQCHEIEMVTTQRFSEEKWGQVVNLMVSRGARLSDDQIAAVVTYLANNLGKADASDSSGLASPSTSAPASPSASSTAPTASENQTAMSERPSLSTPPRPKNRKSFWGFLRKRPKRACSRGKATTTADNCRT